MAYVATVTLALAIIAGLLGIYNLGINMVLGFYLFWALSIIGVALLSLDIKRRHDFL